MNKYHLHQTSLDVSRIAFGCMRLAGKEESGLTAIETALDCGINFFDHADIYGAGKSEEVFAKLWKRQPHIRGKIILQSKCGIRSENSPEVGAPPRYDFSYSHIINSVNGILARLQTDHLDLLLLHRPDPLVEPEEVGRAFDELKQMGKVRYFGVSNHNAAQVELLKTYFSVPIVANQLEVSVLHAGLIEEGILFNQSRPEVSSRGDGTLEYCRLNKVMIQAWSPLAGGRLAGLRNPLSSMELQLNGEINSIALDHHISSEAVMIAWLLRHPARIQPIIGTMMPERVEAICQADGLNMTREEWYRIYNAGRSYRLP